MTTVTLNQILAMENVLATRKIPSDIEAMAKAKRYSESKQKVITLGDQPLHYVLRILAKEGNVQIDGTNAGTAFAMTGYRIQ